MLLSDVSSGRDNNLNLMRMLAALAVLVSHSFALATGNPELEPLKAQLGFTLGTFAVDIFFLISGFLISGSLLKRKSFLDYTWARCTRIFPGLFVAIVLTTFVLGPLVSSIPPLAYLTHGDTYYYLFKNITLVTGVETSLPGVFMNVPMVNAVNGSIWTLPEEFFMYAVLAVFWLVARLIPGKRETAFKVFVIAGLVFLGVLGVMEKILVGGFVIHALRMYTMFFLGSTYFIFRKSIPMKKSLFFLALALTVVSLVHEKLFMLVYIVTIPYAILYLAFVPGGWIRNYNKLGDYSYGVYIYAYPLQQLFISLIPGIDPMVLSGLTLVPTVLLAVGSWHLVEKKALALKEGAYQWSLNLVNKGTRLFAKPVPEKDLTE